MSTGPDLTFDRSTAASRPPALFRRAARQSRLGAMLEVQYGTLRDASELLRESAVMESWARRWEKRRREARAALADRLALEAQREASPRRQRPYKPAELFRLAAQKSHAGALVQIHHHRYREALELLEEGELLLGWAARWERRRFWIGAAILTASVGVLALLFC
jgi:hypothetical protein